MNKQRARAILNEFAERHGDLSALSTGKEIDFEADLFDKQLAVVKSKAKKKAVIAGRRSGKSIQAAYYLISVAFATQRTNVAYIALSRLSAKIIIWDALLLILNRYKIGYKVNLVEQSITLDNGSRILVAGASTEREIEKFRGPSYKLVVVDECGSPQFLPLLENLIENIISPALMDTDGTVELISSPGVVNAGFFYEATTDKIPGWDVHHWTVLDNPKLPRWAGKKDWRALARLMLEELKIDKGWDDETPVYRREYLGEWVEGDEALIYPFSSNNTFKNLPLMDFQFIFGVDLGVVDDATIIVGAYSPLTPNLYIVDEFKQNNMAPSDFAEVLKVYYDRYEPTVIVTDSGGLGKAFVKEIEKRFRMPIEAAQKTNKVGMVTLLQDDFRLGRIKVHDSLVEIKAELYSYIWKDKALKVLPDGEDHLLDALLYAYRRSMHYTGKITPHNPNRLEQELYQHALDKDEKAQSALWYDEYGDEYDY